MLDGIQVHGTQTTLIFLRYTTRSSIVVAILGMRLMQVTSLSIGMAVFQLPAYGFRPVLVGVSVI